MQNQLNIFSRKSKMSEMQDLVNALLAQDKTQVEIVEELLKQFQVSNHEACYLLKSAHGDRRIRNIRERIPKGYIMQTEEDSFKQGKRITRYLKFHLEKVGA